MFSWFRIPKKHKIIGCFQKNTYKTISCTSCLTCKSLEFHSIGEIECWTSGDFCEKNTGGKHIHIYIYHGNPQASFLGVTAPYIGGVKPSFFMVLGSKAIFFYISCSSPIKDSWATGKNTTMQRRKYSYQKPSPLHTVNYQATLSNQSSPISVRCRAFLVFQKSFPPCEWDQRNWIAIFRYGLFIQHSGTPD